MCDAEMVPHREGATPLPMVSTSDLCYLVALYYCYEGVIDWCARRADKQLEVFPEGHTWKVGEPQPGSEEAKQAAIGTAYWTQELGRGNTIRHYYEPCPQPVVSDLEVGVGNSEAGGCIEAS